MRVVKSCLLAGIIASAMAAPAAATTVITFHSSASNADFIAAAPPGVTDRSINWTGSFSYDSGLADGVYGAGSLTSFASTLLLSISISGAPTPLTAEYNFSLGDFTSLALTLAGGLPTEISFAFLPKLPNSASPEFSSTYASIIGDTSLQDEVDFNFGNSPAAMNLAAHSGDGGFSVTATSVPEPASWALMIAGFGAVGASMRRRAAVVRVSYG